MATLGITYNKLRAYSELYNLIMWPTNYDYYTVSNQLQEAFYKD